MNIQENIEQAKKYIANDKLDEALNLLNVSVTSDLNTQDEIFFEIAKIYMLKNEYEKATEFFLKIKENNDLKELANECLFKIYKILNLQDKQIDCLYKMKKENITLDMLKELIFSLTDSKKFLMAFDVVKNYNSCKDNEEIDYTDILKYLYKKISFHIQDLIRNYQYNESRNFFNIIDDYIPKEEKKIKNILLNEYELAQGKTILNSYPRIFNGMLTDKCNLKCIMCNANRGQYYLEDSDIESLVNVMPYLEKLILRGGEVFLHKKFVYILEQAKKNNVDVEIVTNGLLLTEDICNKIFDVVTEITFSIDSVEKNVYEYIRAGAKFEKLLENIDMFNNLNSKRKNKILTRLTMVVMRSNYKEIENIIKFAGENNFQEVYLLPVSGKHISRYESIFEYGFDEKIVRELNLKREYFEKKAKDFSINLCNLLVGNKSLYIENDELFEKIKDSKKEEEIYKKMILKKKNNQACLRKDLIEYEEIIFDKLFCHAPWQQIYIEYFQSFPTCICRYTDGNNTINEKDDFIMSLWNNAQMQTYREKILKGKLYEICVESCLSNCSNNIIKGNMKS